MVDMLSTANDNTYSLPAGTTTTSVNDPSTSANQIYFRIGLTDRLSVNAVPRYGLIILSYNNNTKYQAIYIRQGHHPDYLMRNGNPQDAYDNYTVLRTQSVKFTPYNLTDPLGYNGSTNVTLHTQLPVSGQPIEAHFTQYPSQVGYVFQWAVPANQRRAFHPTNPLTGGYSNWQVGYSSGTDYWGGAGGYGATNESCPAGYRRPNNGTTTADASTAPISTSEARESLFITGTANTYNTVMGLIADGFFDRRTIHEPWTDVYGLCVSYSPSTLTLNKHIAMSGSMIFNPSNNASIFLPHWIILADGGIRYDPRPLYGLTKQLVHGVYATSSKEIAGNPIHVILTRDKMDDIVRGNAVGRVGSGETTNKTGYAMSIRCIKDD
jgi:hypothetical protein